MTVVTLGDKNDQDLRQRPDDTQQREHYPILINAGHVYTTPVTSMGIHLGSGADSTGATSPDTGSTGSAGDD